MPQVAPKPDPATGEPRPPRAPTNVAAQSAGKTDAQRARFPSAPAGEGKVLEWYQQTNDTGVKAGFFASVLVVGFLCLKDWGVSWMSSWVLWMFVLVPVPVFYLYGRAGGVSAGADWFASSKKTYVKLYELSSVTVTESVGVQPWNLELRDKHGGYAGASLRELQQNRALWDLVYNGIAHSVLRGPATANDKALEKLQLR